MFFNDGIYLHSVQTLDQTSNSNKTRDGNRGILLLLGNLMKPNDSATKHLRLQQAQRLRNAATNPPARIASPFLHASPSPAAAGPSHAKPGWAHNPIRLWSCLPGKCRGNSNRRSLAKPAPPHCATVSISRSASDPSHIVGVFRRYETHHCC